MARTWVIIEGRDGYIAGSQGDVIRFDEYQAYPGSHRFIRDGQIIEARPATEGLIWPDGVTPQ